MIDFESIKETGHGDRFDRLTALLIGIVALLAAGLVVIQTTESLAEARGNAQARRLASELTTRIITSGTLGDQRIVNGQRALFMKMEGTARAFVAIGSGDAAEEQIGQAHFNAGARLGDIALEMGAAPGPSGPLDPYARAVFATITDDLFAMLAEQNAAADSANVASTRSSRAVMGLSVVALAGVLVGLAAVVGGGRSGRALLLLAWISAAGAGALLLMASGAVAI